MDARQRQERGRLGANTKWANCTDRTAATQPARDAFFQRFIDKVPVTITEPESRIKAAEALMKEHYRRLGAASAERRRAKATGHNDRSPSRAQAHLRKLLDGESSRAPEVSG